MMLEDVFCPLKIRFKTKKNGKASDTVRTLTKLQTLLPDSNDQHAFRVGVIDAVKESCIEDMNKKQLRAFLLEVVGEELTARGLPTRHASAVRDQLWYEWCRKMIKKKGINVSAIDIELLDKVENPFKALLRYTSGKVGGFTFSEIRQAIARGITIEDCEALAEERGGECLGVVEY
jgi:hypothetical protein